jgi:hypothetical protein
MKIRFAVAFVCGVGIGISAPPVNAQDAEELLPMPYLDRITALQPPINALIRYAPTDKRQFVTQIVWGPEKAPNLYQMRATGEVWIDGTSDAPIVNIERAATEVAFGPKQSQRPDAGQIFANISPLGAFKLLKLDLPNLDAREHRLQFSEIGTHLIDQGKIPPYRRISLRSGPDDTGGNVQEAAERTARVSLLEAMQPMLGMVSMLPAQGLHTGSKLTVLRRDLGNLFSGAGPIPLSVQGTVTGLAEFAERRYVALRLEDGDLPLPMRANVEGYALIDIETALLEVIVANIELVVVHGTDTSVFRFIEQRVLVPDPNNR